MKIIAYECKMNDNEKGMRNNLSLIQFDMSK